MKALWQGLWWLVRKLLFLVTLVLAGAGALTFGSGLTWEPMASGPARVYWNWQRWWDVITEHLAHLLRGQLVPPFMSGVRGFDVKADLLATVPVTLKLVGTAFVASVIVGILLGILLSTFAPAWLRAPLWAGTTMLHAVPDMVVATAFDLAFVLVNIVRGGGGPSQGSVTWQKYTALPCEPWRRRGRYTNLPAYCATASGVGVDDGAPVHAGPGQQVVDVGPVCGAVRSGASVQSTGGGVAPADDQPHRLAVEIACNIRYSQF